MHLGKLFFLTLYLVSTQVFAQQIGTVKTEEYTANFEKKKSLESLPPYEDTIQVPIQILKIGISEEVYEMYPELKDARVGMGVYIEVYDFSVGEDEVVETSGVTIKQVTQLGLQIRFVDAESGEVITGSGQGRAITTKTSTTLGDIEGPTFNKSTVGVSTKKALETASVRVVEKLIKKGKLRS